jgi:hypothetical protein
LSLKLLVSVANTFLLRQDTYISNFVNPVILKNKIYVSISM